ncbi:MAG: MBL fold metallo-hydrolase, partial [Rhizomicrobium sp.]
MLRKLVKFLPLAALLALPASAKDTALQMVSIDVEGGGGTLFVTPDGKSLLIDTGNPEISRATGDHPSSERIVAAAHALGLKKIDTLLITHYHGDHIGGFEGLLARIPIGTVIDHGENRETTASTQAGAPQIDLKNPPPGSTAAGYNRYVELIGKRRHVVAKAGDVFHIGGMTVTIVMADAQPIAKALPGAGENNPSCAGMEAMANNG